MKLESLTKEELLEVVKAAIAEDREAHPLSDEEINWVRLAIKAQVERAELRKAIIEKTLATLVWAALAGMGYYFVEWFSTHWVK